jgi:hypothetical protein
LFRLLTALACVPWQGLKVPPLQAMLFQLKVHFPRVNSVDTFSQAVQPSCRAEPS